MGTSGGAEGGRPTQRAYVLSRALGYPGRSIHYYYAPYATRPTRPPPFTRVPPFHLPAPSPAMLLSVGPQWELRRVGLGGNFTKWGWKTGFQSNPPSGVVKLSIG